MLNEKEKKALIYFNSNLGKTISLQDIIVVTGWAESTVKTYYNKYWQNKVLQALGVNSYKVILASPMNENSFKALQTQVKH